MAKANNKTIANDLSIADFLSKIEDDKRRSDAQLVHDLLTDLITDSPKMWGTSIVGFGEYHYKYESGREGDFFKVGYSPRKQNLAIYIIAGFDRYDELMTRLGKYKTGKSCLYIKKIEDVNLEVLKDLITQSYDYMTDKYG
jgi:hypothetical protein